jgi:hypothetical protein
VTPGEFPTSSNGFVDIEKELREAAPLPEDIKLPDDVAKENKDIEGLHWDAESGVLTAPVDWNDPNQNSTLAGIIESLEEQGYEINPGDISLGNEQVEGEFVQTNWLVDRARGLWDRVTGRGQPRQLQSGTGAAIVGDPDHDGVSDNQARRAVGSGGAIPGNRVEAMLEHNGMLTSVRTIASERHRAQVQAERQRREAGQQLGQQTVDGIHPA